MRTASNSVFSILLAVIFFISCENTLPKNGAVAENKSAVSAPPDSIAIADAIHNFYTWYDANSIRLGKTYNFTVEGGAHTTLDEKQLQLFFADIKKSGFVSDELIADETKFYQACAKIWQTEDKDEINTGLESERFLCAQDYIAPYNTGTVTSIINGNRAQTTLTLTGSMPGETNAFTYEMKKENGKWLLAKLGCDMGVKY